ncbi:protein of unknown function [Cardinium endosymbiont cEper1 of Encarsia pergandiella]|nr:protein of unknown function [Cardinium endosymbiont cEper1 of Encarsia pergandiella]
MVRQRRKLRPSADRNYTTALISLNYKSKAVLVVFFANEKALSESFWQLLTLIFFIIMKVNPTKLLILLKKVRYNRQKQYWVKSLLNDSVNHNMEFYLFTKVLISYVMKQ